MKNITKQKIHLHKWRRRESKYLTKSIQIWSTSKTLKKIRKIKNKNDENHEKNVERKIFIHVDQHKQFCNHLKNAKLSIWWMNVYIYEFEF